MWMVTEQHTIGRGQRQCIAGTFFPRQVLWPWHQLLCLHVGELGKRAIRGFIAPNPLRIGIHRIAAVTFLIIAIILIAVDDHFIADFPTGDFLAHSPNDAGCIGTGDMKRRLVNIKGTDRNAQTGPHAVVVHARSHHEHQHLMTVRFWCIDHFNLKGFVRLTMTFATNGPRVHLGGHMPHRRHFTQFIKVLFRCVVRNHLVFPIQCHSFFPHFAAMQNRVFIGNYLQESNNATDIG